LKDERIALRLSAKDRQRAEHLIKDGKFKTLSQVIRTALDEFLKKQGD
jgi:Arc/MetJ-type ribon-helix-helix transcriptional regulator